MFSQSKSKQELEKIYNKRSNQTGEEFDNQFKTSVAKYNDKLRQDQILKNQYDDYDVIGENEIINIEATSLLSEKINLKYESPLKNLESRLRWIRGISIVLHILALIYLIYVIIYLDDLVSFTGVIRYLPPTQKTNIYVDLLPSGSKIIYGSQMFTLCFYFIGVLVYHLHIFVSFIPVSIFKEEQEEELIEPIFSPYFILQFRSIVSKVFIAYSLIFSLGVLSQIYYYHYERGLNAFLQSKKGDLIQMLAFGLTVVLVQLAKIGLQLVIILFSVRLKHYSMKYVQITEHLRQINQK